MKKIFKLIGIISIVTIIGFTTACKDDISDRELNGWTPINQIVFELSDQINTIAYGNGKFVAGGNGGKMAISTDGITWTAVSTHST